MKDIQAELIFKIQKLCKDLNARHSQNLNEEKAFRAAQVLLGRHYKPRLRLPRTARVVWSKREGRDHDLNPLQFYKKYWDRYADVLTQRDFRRLDQSLFDAIRFHCRQHQLDAKEYLPPPAREHQAKQGSARPTSQRRNQPVSVRRAA